MSCIYKKLIPFKIRQFAVRFSTRVPDPVEEDSLSIHEKGELPKPTKIIHGEPYPEWRQPWSELKGEWRSKFAVFGNDSTFHTSIMGFMGRQERMTVQEWLRWKKEKKEIEDQTFLPQRHDTLGSNLATAHFICHRGGKVKFIGDPEWIMRVKEDELPLPSRYVQKMILEAVNCENFHNGGLRYEGLDNLINLKGLKSLSIKGNKHIDDWGLDKITCLTHKTLQSLDISDCSITHRGLVALYRMTSLKLLTLTGDQSDQQLEQACAMLEELHPELLINIV